MSSLTVISVKNLSKSYRLGAIGSRTLTEDLNRWWAKVRNQPDPTLRIGQEHLAERLGERIWALKDINFEVQQGEALGIIGRNGAGKSTLLKILSRITAPTTGEVRVKGRIASLLEVGTGFHPELTGRENIFLNGAILGMKRPEIERKFDEIVDFAGVEKFIDTPVKRYSSGMYVRLAFAVAAHLDPEILVVDEVLAVGDAEFQKKCLGKMGEVAGEGRTVLFVSHNMGAIQQLCRSCLVLVNGKVDFQGDTKEAITKYISNANYHLFSKRKGPLASNELREFYLEEITLTKQNGTKVSSILTGEDININLYLKSKKKIKNLIITLGINDNYGTRLSLIHSELAGFRLSQTELHQNHICSIRKLNLLPGKYIVDVKIYDDREPVIWLNNAYELFVETGNILQTGKLPSKEWGGYFTLDYDWI